MRTIEELEHLKATGNECFRRKDYHGALEQYRNWVLKNLMRNKKRNR